MGAAYLENNLQKRSALFLIQLEHSEGELAVGLGRRIFDSDCDTEDRYAIEWFERKNKRVAYWGMQPGFRLAVESYDARRRPIIVTSLEDRSQLLPIAVKTLQRAQAPTSRPSPRTACRRCEATWPATRVLARRSLMRRRLNLEEGSGCASKIRKWLCVRGHTHLCSWLCVSVVVCVAPRGEQRMCRAARRAARVSRRAESSARVAPRGKDLHVYGKYLHVYGKDLHVYGKDLHVSGKDLHVYGNDLHVYGKDLHVSGKDLHVSGKDLHTTQTHTTTNVCDHERDCSPTRALLSARRDTRATLRAARHTHCSPRGATRALLSVRRDTRTALRASRHACCTCTHRSITGSLTMLLCL
jgi:hypothetical protein